jgi:hypothetical protein
MADPITPMFKPFAESAEFIQAVDTQKALEAKLLAGRPAPTNIPEAKSQEVADTTTRKQAEAAGASPAEQQRFVDIDTMGRRDYELKYGSDAGHEWIDNKFAQGAASRPQYGGGTDDPLDVALNSALGFTGTALSLAPTAVAGLANVIDDPKSIARGVRGAAQFAADLAGVGQGFEDTFGSNTDPDSILSSEGEEVGIYGDLAAHMSRGSSMLKEVFTDLQSDAYKREVANQAQEIGEIEGIKRLKFDAQGKGTRAEEAQLTLSMMGEGLAQAVSNPTEGIPQLIESLPYMFPGIGAARGVAALNAGKVASATDKIRKASEGVKKAQPKIDKANDKGLFRAADKVDAEVSGKLTKAQDSAAALNKTVARKQKAALALTVGITEGTATGVDVFNAVQDASHEDLLAHSGEYQRLIEAGSSQADAKKKVALTQAGEKQVVGGLVSTLLAGTIGSALDKSVAKIGGSNAVPTTLKGKAGRGTINAASEGLEEVGQSGTSAYLSNLAEQETTNPDKILTEGVGAAAGKGLALGVATGPALSATGTALKVGLGTSIVAGKLGIAAAEGVAGLFRKDVDADTDIDPDKFAAVLKTTADIGNRATEIEQEIADKPEAAFAQTIEAYKKSGLPQEEIDQKVATLKENATSELAEIRENLSQVEKTGNLQGVLAQADRLSAALTNDTEGEVTPDSQGRIATASAVLELAQTAVQQDVANNPVNAEVLASAQSKLAADPAAVLTPEETSEIQREANRIVYSNVYDDAGVDPMSAEQGQLALDIAERAGLLNPEQVTQAKNNIAIKTAEAVSDEVASGSRNSGFEGFKPKVARFKQALRTGIPEAIQTTKDEVVRFAENRIVKHDAYMAALATATSTDKNVEVINPETGEAFLTTNAKGEEVALVAMPDRRGSPNNLTRGIARDHAFAQKALNAVNGVVTPAAVQETQAAQPETVQETAPVQGELDLVQPEPVQGELDLVQAPVEETRTEDALQGELFTLTEQVDAGLDTGAQSVKIAAIEQELENRAPATTPTQEVEQTPAPVEEAQPSVSSQPVDTEVSTSPSAETATSTVEQVDTAQQAEQSELDNELAQADDNNKAARQKHKEVVQELKKLEPLNRKLLNLAKRLKSKPDSETLKTQMASVTKAVSDLGYTPTELRAHIDTLRKDRRATNTLTMRMRRLKDNVVKRLNVLKNIKQAEHPVLKGTWFNPYTEDYIRELAINGDMTYAEATKRHTNWIHRWGKFVQTPLTQFNGEILQKVPTLKALSEIVGKPLGAQDVTTFKQFKALMNSAAFNEFLDNLDKTEGLGIAISELGNESNKSAHITSRPYHYLMDHTGKFPTVVKEAIAMNMISMIQNKGRRLSAATNYELKQSLGLDQATELPPGAVTLLAQAGQEVSILRNGVGKDVLATLGVKFTKEIPENLQDNINTSLGDVVLTGMVEAGLLERLDVPMSELGPLLSPAIADSFKDNKKKKTFIRLKRDNEGETASFPAQVLASGERSNRVMDSFINPTKEPSTVGFTPFTGQSEFLRRTKTKVTDIAKQANEIAQRTPHRASKEMFDLMDIMTEGEFLTLFGFKTPEGNKNTVEKIQGKNMQLQRSYSQLNALRDRIQGDVDQQDLFFQYQFSQTMRQFLDSDISPQGDKLVRAFLGTRANIAPTENGKPHLGMLLGLAQGLDMDPDKESNQTTFDNIDALLTGSNPVTLAMDAIQDFYADSNSVPRGEMAGLLTAALAFTGQAGKEPEHAVQAMMEFARYKTHLESGSDAPFNTSMYYEIDGVTNGPFNAMVLLGSPDVTDVESLNGYLTKLERGGLMHHNESTNPDYHAKRGGGNTALDNYYQISDLANVAMSDITDRLTQDFGQFDNLTLDIRYDKEGKALIAHNGKILQFMPRDKMTAQDKQVFFNYGTDSNNLVINIANERLTKIIPAFDYWLSRARYVDGNNFFTRTASKLRTTATIYGSGAASAHMQDVKELMGVIYNDASKLLVEHARSPNPRLAEDAQALMDSIAPMMAVRKEGYTNPNTGKTVPPTIKDPTGLKVTGDPVKFLTEFTFTPAHVGAMAGNFASNQGGALNLAIQEYFPELLLKQKLVVSQSNQAQVNYIAAYKAAYRAKRNELIGRGLLSDRDLLPKGEVQKIEDDLKHIAPKFAFATSDIGDVDTYWDGEKKTSDENAPIGLDAITTKKGGTKVELLNRSRQDSTSRGWSSIGVKAVPMMVISIDATMQIYKLLMDPLSKDGNVYDAFTSKPNNLDRSGVAGNLAAIQALKNHSVLGSVGDTFQRSTNESPFLALETWAQALIDGDSKNVFSGGVVETNIGDQFIEPLALVDSNTPDAHWLNRKAVLARLNALDAMGAKIFNYPVTDWAISIVTEPSIPMPQGDIAPELGEFLAVQKAARIRQSVSEVNVADTRTALLLDGEHGKFTFQQMAGKDGASTTVENGEHQTIEDADIDTSLVTTAMAAMTARQRKFSDAILARENNLPLDAEGRLSHIQSQIKQGKPSRSQSFFRDVQADLQKYVSPEVMALLVDNQSLLRDIAIEVVADVPVDSKGDPVYLGKYDPDANLITISNSLPDAGRSLTVAHEYLHAIFSNVLQREASGQPLSANEQAMIDELKTTLAKLDGMAISDIPSPALKHVKGLLLNGDRNAALDELIAYGLTDAATVSWLKDQPIHAVNNSIIGRIKQALQTFFGLKDDGYTQFLSAVYGLSEVQTFDGLEATQSSPVRFSVADPRQGNFDRFMDMTEAQMNTLSQGEVQVFDSIKKLVRVASQNGLGALPKNDNFMSSPEKARAFTMPHVDYRNTVYTAKSLGYTGLTVQLFGMYASAIKEASANNFKESVRLNNFYAAAQKQLTPADFLETTANPDSAAYADAMDIAELKYAELFENPDTAGAAVGFFAAHVQLNPAFKQIVARVRVPKERTQGTVLENSIVDSAEKVVGALAAKMGKEIHSDSTLAQTLKRILKPMDESIKTDFEILDTLGTKIDGIDDAVADYATRAIGTLAEQTGKLGADEVSLALTILADPTWVGEIIDEMLEIGVKSNSLNGFFRNSLKEVRGNTKLQLRANAAKRIKVQTVETHAQNIRDRAPIAVTALFNKLTKKQDIALGQGILDADVSSLLEAGVDMDTVVEMMGLDSAATQQVIGDLEAQLNGLSAHANIKTFWLNQAEHMGKSAITGKVYLEHQTPNAKVAAHLVTHPAKNSARLRPAESVMDEAETLIDALSSLYALQTMPAENRALVREMVTTDPEGIAGAIEYAKSVKQKENDKYPNSDLKFTRVKGKTFDLLDYEQDFRTVPVGQVKGYVRKGYSKGRKFIAAHNGKEYQEVYTDVATNAPWQQGQLTLIEDSVSGISPYTGKPIGSRSAAQYVTSFKPLAATKLSTQRVSVNQGIAGGSLPSVSPVGTLVAAYVPVNQHSLNTYLSSNNQLSNKLGHWDARQHEEIQGKKSNELLAKSLAVDAARSSDSALVTLSENHPDKIVRDAWAVLPKAFLQAWDRENGKKTPIRVHRDVFYDVIGFRKRTVLDLWANDDQFSRGTVILMRKMFGNEAMRVAFKGEAGIQEMVKLGKDIVAIKSIVVPAANALSNFHSLGIRNVPYKAMEKYGFEAIRGVREYKRTALQIVEAEVTATASPTSGNISRLAQLKQRQKINPVMILINEGLLPSVVEDLSVERNDLFSHPGKLSELIDNTTKHVPDSVLDFGKAALLMKGSKTYSVMNQAVEYGDFVAKYILYKHNVDIKAYKTHEKNVQAVATEFVDYGKNLDPTMQYLNDMGLAHFVKYAIRMPAVQVDMIRKNPTRALTTLIANGMGIMPANPLETTLFNKDYGFSTGTLDMFMKYMEHPLINIVD